MTHVRARFALLAAMAAAFLAAMVPALAEAAPSYYNCASKPPWALCDGRANGTFDGIDDYDYNRATYTGGGAVIVCQGLLHHSSSTWLPMPNCSSGSNNYIDYYYGNITCVCYEANVSHATDGNYTLYGFADPNF
jgi:hypothetical protein